MKVNIPKTYCQLQILRLFHIALIALSLLIGQGHGYSTNQVFLEPLAPLHYVQIERPLTLPPIVKQNFLFLLPADNSGNQLLLLDSSDQTADDKKEEIKIPDDYEVLATAQGMDDQLKNYALRVAAVAIADKKNNQTDQQIATAIKAKFDLLKGNYDADLFPIK